MNSHKLFTITSSLLTCCMLNGVEVSQDLKNKYKRPTEIPFPDNNPHTPERETLGKFLFFDTRMSGSGILSCASCHNPSFAWGDGLPRGVGHGHQELARKTPTILNSAWNELQFWDGRAESLEEQALGPIEAEKEMNMSLEEAVGVINSIESYKKYFEAAYPGEGITKDTIAKAIATFERTVVSSQAPFDKWINGDEDAISDEAKRGFLVYNNQARCDSCHSGWNFSDSSFHDIGVKSDDKGLGAVLEIESMNHAFKTPTLRNVTQRAPYMHNGSEETLRQVIELYNIGGRVQRPTLSNEMKPLHLTEQEKSDLLAFLKTLTSEDPEVVIPVLPN